MLGIMHEDITQYDADSNTYYIINDEEYISIITTKGTGKRVRLAEFEKTSRARKGILLIRDVKTNPYYILNSYIIKNKANVGLKFKEDIEYIKVTELPIVDRYSTGTSLSKKEIYDTFIETNLTDPSKMDEVVEKKEISLDSIDAKIMTIDDFLDNMEK